MQIEFLLQFTTLRRRLLLFIIFEFINNQYPERKTQLAQIFDSLQTQSIDTLEK